MENKESFIKKVFNTIADDYDKMNLILTGGFFPVWQKRLIKKMKVTNEERIIDICCGSGKMTAEIAELLSSAKGGKIIGIDFSENMLIKAKERVLNKNLPVEFFYQDALNLEFKNESFDKAVNSFALRNLNSIDKALSEMYRVLNEDGSLFVLEVSKPENKFVRFFFEIFYYNMVPLIGKISDKGKKINGKYSAYEWLSESLKKFPEKKEIISAFYKAGFKEVSTKSYGFGGISLYIAKK